MLRTMISVPLLFVAVVQAGPVFEYTSQSRRISVAAATGVQQFEFRDDERLAEDFGPFDETISVEVGLNSDTGVPASALAHQHSVMESARLFMQGTLATQAVPDSDDYPGSRAYAESSLAVEFDVVSATGYVLEATGVSLRFVGPGVDISEGDEPPAAGRLLPGSYSLSVNATGGEHSFLLQATAIPLAPPLRAGALLMACAALRLLKLTTRAN